MGKVGTRAQVWHGTAEKTPGGLRKKDLVMKRGRIRSRKASRSAKRNGNLRKAGWTFKKGEFGAVRVGEEKKRTGSRKKRSKSGSRKKRSKTGSRKKRSRTRRNNTRRIRRGGAQKGWRSAFTQQAFDKEDERQAAQEKAEREQRAAQIAKGFERETAAKMKSMGFSGRRGGPTGLESISATGSVFPGQPSQGVDPVMLDAERTGTRSLTTPPINPTNVVMRNRMNPREGDWLKQDKDTAWAKNFGDAGR